MPAGRVRSLDVFRGLTVAAMILVNSPGRDDTYAWTSHAPWNGCTFADLVFPFFLLIMGASAALSHHARSDAGAAALRRRALKRAAVLFGLGLLENAFVYHTAGGMRWPGVLQRIAVCYLGLELLQQSGFAGWAAAGAALSLCGYWALLRFSTPAGAHRVLTPDSLPYRVDRLLMGAHTLTPDGDPEGVLSTLPAFGTALIGLAAGRRLAERGRAAAGELARDGASLAALGALWGLWMPLNKHLWTSSYAAFTAGLALLALAALLATEGAQRWRRPFEALGRHALAAYVLSGLAYDVLEFIHLRLPTGEEGNVKLWITSQVLQRALTPRGAALAYALGFTAASIAAAELWERRARRGAHS